MFSMSKITPPIVAPDGSIDAYCMPKVVQPVLIAVVGNMSVIVDRDDVQSECPLVLFCVHLCFPSL